MKEKIMIGRITKRGRGQRSKFTRTRQRIIYEALRQRLPITRAVQLADVSYVVYRGWMIKGRESINRFHHRFRKKVKRLQSAREIEALNIIREVAKGGKEIKERKIVRGPRGREITLIKKMTQPHWQAAVRYLELIGGAAYSKEAIHSLSEEQLLPPQQNINMNVSGTVEHEHSNQQLEALRLLPVEELKTLATILTTINTGTCGDTAIPPTEELSGKGVSGKVSTMVH